MFRECFCASAECPISSFPSAYSFIIRKIFLVKKSGAAANIRRRWRRPGPVYSPVHRKNMFPCQTAVTVCAASCAGFSVFPRFSAEIRLSDQNCGSGWASDFSGYGRNLQIPRLDFCFTRLQVLQRIRYVHRHEKICRNQMYAKSVSDPGSLYPVKNLRISIVMPQMPLYETMARPVCCLAAASEIVSRLCRR